MISVSVIAHDHYKLSVENFPFNSTIWSVAVDVIVVLHEAFVRATTQDLAKHLDASLNLSLTSCKQGGTTEFSHTGTCFF